MWRVAKRNLELLGLNSPTSGGQKKGESLRKRVINLENAA